MPRSSHIAALLSALALVFPGAALAQGSASGDTYQDPFPNQTGGNGGSGQSSGSQGTSSGGTAGTSSGSSSGSGSSPTATASTGSNGASGASGSSTSGSAGANGQLPRTGLDASIFAFVGAVLIASGVAIRRRIPAFWR